MNTSVKLIPVALGWARNAVNTAIFRKNALVTAGAFQYLGFYDPDGQMVLAQRRVDSTEWTFNHTGHSGDTADAHNGISLGIDRAGHLHVSYDHHNHPLRYRRATAPASLDLGPERAMTGVRESRVTYPQFYNQPDGTLLFLYRDGRSGSGDLMLNCYDPDKDIWTVVQQGFVGGEGQRNAYPNLLGIGADGALHLSWCWRETPDVATNHDICYARSTDGGVTWTRSNGAPLTLPITLDNAEYVRRIPQNVSLINQCSMTVDADGHPVIAAYWQPAGSDAPQYFVVYHNGKGWQDQPISARTGVFRLGGTGSRRIPISRPLVLAGKSGALYVIYRDSERGGGVSVAVCEDPAREIWQTFDLTREPLGFWEPAVDHARWAQDETLHLLVQRVGQGDSEGLEDMPPQMVSVLEWSPRG